MSRDRTDANLDRAAPKCVAGNSSAAHTQVGRLDVVCGERW